MAKRWIGFGVILLILVWGSRTLFDSFIDFSSVVPSDESVVGAPFASQISCRLTSRNTFPIRIIFRNRLSATARASLCEMGVREVGVLSAKELLVEVTEAQMARLRTLSFVDSVSSYLPQEKISPALTKLLTVGPARVEVCFSLLHADDAAKVCRELSAKGGVVHEVGALTVTASIPRETLPAMTEQAEVRWVEPAPKPVLTSDLALTKQRMNVRSVRDVWGLTGDGVRVAHTDSGCDTGILDQLHPDLAGQVMSITPLSDQTKGADSNGHGTHTAGLIVGNGTCSDGKYTGSAPGSRLVHYAFAIDSDGTITGLPTDLSTLFIRGWEQGAKIHSASWGAPSSDTYTIWDRGADQFSWEHPTFLLVNSAGNSGADEDGNGIVDLRSLSHPASAKNVLTVGATESGRPVGSGGATSYTWLSFSFYDDPIRNDRVSSSTNGMIGMAAFSSRGPTMDGRMKPDVVAPGTDIISTKSSLGGTIWGGVPSFEDRYTFAGGTSMATPLVAGGVALLQEYWTARMGNSDPSSAILRAMMTGGARSRAPGQYDAAHQEIPNVSPNPVEGWGEVDVAGTLYPENAEILAEDFLRIVEGDARIFTVRVIQTNSPLSVVLAWVDYPALQNASKILVNDYDLTVVAPDGTVFYPNGGSTSDSVNTTESVKIIAQPGVYTIRIAATSCPYGPDEGGAVALYARGGFEAQPRIVPQPCQYEQVGDVVRVTVPFLAHALAPLTNQADSAMVRYAAGSDTARTGEWVSVSASFLSNSLYEAELEIPWVGRCFYQIDVAGTNGTRVTTAESSILVDRVVSLTVSGNPQAYGASTPEYGTHSFPAGTEVTLSAAGPAYLSGTERVRCQGYVGAGSIPFFGTETSVVARIMVDSGITWSWKSQYLLQERMEVLNESGSIVYQADTRASWHDQGATAETDATLEVGWLNGNPYAFSYWTLDGNAQFPSDVSLADLEMSTTHTATAVYLPYWLDSDQDGLSDWWSLRYFGQKTGVDSYADPDGDGWDNFYEFLDNTDPNDVTSYPVPPTVVVETLAPFQKEYPPWRVTARVEDNLAVEEVFLLWREEGDSSWAQLKMQVEGSGTNVQYAASFSPPTLGKKRVEYQVAAFDLLGYYSYYQFGTVSEIYKTVADYDQAVLAITPEEDLDLRFLSDSPITNFSFSVTNRVGPAAQWAASLQVATDYSATNGWESYGWHRTTRRTENAGRTVWYCGNESTGQYDVGAYSILISPAMAVTNAATLAVRSWIQSEMSSDVWAWDGGLVEISADGGTSWSILTPNSGYSCTIVENADSPLGDGTTPCFASAAGTWETILFPLDDYIGKTIRIRFRFAADLYTQDEGWYLGSMELFQAGSVPSWLEGMSLSNGTLVESQSGLLAYRILPENVPAHQPIRALLSFSGTFAKKYQPLSSWRIRKGNLLSLQAKGNGTLQADETFLCAPENNPVLTARAAEYAHVDLVWGTGGEVFAFATNAPCVTFTLEDLRRDTTVVASFAENLAAHDVPERWYASWGWTNDFTTAGNADADGDSVPTWQEYHADTCPTNGASALRILSVTNGVLTWMGGLTQNQFVEYTESLTNQWRRIFSVSSPTPLTNAIPITPGAERGFFRISVEDRME